MSGGENGARTEAHPLSLTIVLVGLARTMIADCLNFNLNDSVRQIEYLVCI